PAAAEERHGLAQVRRCDRVEGTGRGPAPAVGRCARCARHSGDCSRRTLAKVTFAATESDQLHPVDEKSGAEIPAVSDRWYAALFDYAPKNRLDSCRSFRGWRRTRACTLTLE